MTPESLDYRLKLRQCMVLADILSLRSLSTSSGVSRRQIGWVQVGEAHRLSVHDALQLARSLQLSLAVFLQQFSPVTEQMQPSVEPSEAIVAEYQRLKGAIATSTRLPD
jgi:hypothetical protein